MRPQMIYKTAIDWWFWAVIGATFALIFAVSVPLIQQGDSVALWTIGFTVLVGLGLPLWLAFSTEYETSDTHLLVRSGPFRWSIERATIRDIQPSRSVISSPALSLDRLEIKYGSGQTILVSPADKDAFIKDLSDGL